MSRAAPLTQLGPAPARHLLDVAPSTLATDGIRIARRYGPAPAHRRATRPHALRELLLVATLWAGYNLGRLLADGHVPAAMANGHRVWDLERTLHLPNEATVQHWMSQSEPLIRAANSYYAYLHFPATVAFLVWLYLRRPGYYRWARNSLAALTGAALVVHLLVPLAPPRMLARTGLVDTAARYGPSVYGPPGADDLTNQYAAMPSLHVGWALLVATGLIVATRTRWRWLWLLHPAITLTVVVATANHYWLDGIVAGAIVAVIPFLFPMPQRAVAERVARWPGTAHTWSQRRGVPGMMSRRGRPGHRAPRGGDRPGHRPRHGGGTGRGRALRRIGIAVAGGVIILAGLLMLVLPGPGWLTIFAGLSLLGREFPWAKRLADRPRRGLVRLRDRWRESSARRRSRAG
ncbi:phosphatase PAP2 family protein [Micromonospora sp. NPDC050417]|uniref:phosphatase PAP2 family protein n=1 Tax=Micromonospora sp. NPDC050417 TaxID=3364280 RepID=UPI0037A6C088